MFHALCWDTQSARGACTPIQLLEIDILLRLLFVEKVSARIQADKMSTSICAILKAEKKQWPDNFLGESKASTSIGDCPRLTGYCV